MAWDSRSSRRRQSSAASGTRSLAIQARNQARQAIQAKSPHVADPFLRDFLVPSFDAAAYLNATLPPLQVPSGLVQQQPSSSSSSSSSLSASTKPQQQNQTPPAPLAELSQLAQNNLSQLSAHTTRLTNTLTQLTDEILRSGGRLAYEVELLRGETLGLSETLTESLQDEISKFVLPGSIPTSNPTGGAAAGPAENGSTTATATATTGTSAGGGHSRRLSLIGSLSASSQQPAPHTTTIATTAADGATPTQPQPQPSGENNSTGTTAAATAAPPDPPHITKLRTLALVRSRLESVIQTFGSAMEFVFPPSELSLSSGFLSVSAPDAGGQNHSTEEKGQQVLQSLRDEIAALLQHDNKSEGGGGGGGDPIKGVEMAVKRIEELKELTTVWSGTAEEKGRIRFVEGLARLVEERHRELVEQAQREGGGQQQLLLQGQGQGQGSKRAGGYGGNGNGDVGGEAGKEESSNNKGYGGLIGQLQKLRGGI